MHCLRSLSNQTTSSSFLSNESIRNQLQWIKTNHNTSSSSSLMHHREAWSTSKGEVVNNDKRAACESGDTAQNFELVLKGRFRVQEGVVTKGAYGSLFTAIDLKSNTQVAAKKLSYVNKTRSSVILALREVRILKLLGCVSNHPNIVTLVDAHVEMSSSADSVNLWLFMEHFPIDLQQLIDSKQKLTSRHYSCIIFQLLCGVAHLHSFNIIHRDLKPSNLLLDESCNLRICDFGLARVMLNNNNTTNRNDNVDLGQESPYDAPDQEGRAIDLTEYVVTRWYRAPEVLKGKQYGPAVDVWSAGCIFAELISRRPLFPGRDPAHQLKLIIETPLFTSLHVHSNSTEDTTNLISKMLTVNPKSRITAEQATQDYYFISQQLKSPEISTISTTSSTSRLDSEGLLRMEERESRFNISQLIQVLISGEAGEEDRKH